MFSHMACVAENKINNQKEKRGKNYESNSIRTSVI